MGEKPDCEARRALEVPGYSRWKPFGLGCDLVSYVLFGIISQPGGLACA